MKSSQEVIERYDHHGKSVAVRTELKGKHREHCLCFVCNNLTLKIEKKIVQLPMLYIDYVP